MIVRYIDHQSLDPRGDFKLVEHCWPEAGSAEVVLVGDSATAIGWIPLYKQCEQLPDCFLKQAWQEGDSSIPLLLRSGNTEPNEQFGGPGDLARLDHNFRAIVSIDQPTLYLNVQGRPTLLQFLAKAEVGVTPIRTEYLVSPSLWYSWYSGGDHIAGGDISVDPDAVTIRLFLKLRIGRLGRLVGRLTTGYWPPYASAKIEYVFDLRDPARVQISFHGSTVPSQRQYLNWRRAGDYRMEYQMSQAGYEGFLKANGLEAQSYRLNTLYRPLMVRPISTEPAHRDGEASEEDFEG